MNYATYFADSEGRIACCGVDYHHPYWFSDGYADYLRHLNWIMGALPDLAPIGENHLLRSTSVVQKVTYQPHHIAYRTFDDAGTEVLRVELQADADHSWSFTIAATRDFPEAGYTIRSVTGGDYILQIRRQGARDVTVEGS